MTNLAAQTIPQGAAQISTGVQLDRITLAGVVDNGPGVATASRSHAVVFVDTLTFDSTTLAKSPSLQRGEDPNMTADIVGYAFAPDGSTFYGLHPTELAQPCWLNRWPVLVSALEIGQQYQCAAHCR
jgi:hypothetical protein